LFGEVIVRGEAITLAEMPNMTRAKLSALRMKASRACSPPAAIVARRAQALCEMAHTGQRFCGYHTYQKESGRQEILSPAYGGVGSLKAIADRAAASLETTCIFP
jgi:hypothetical protein